MSPDTCKNYLVTMYKLRGDTEAPAFLPRRVGLNFRFDAEWCNRYTVATGTAATSVARRLEPDRMRSTNEGRAAIQCVFLPLSAWLPNSASSTVNDQSRFADSTKM